MVLYTGVWFGKAASAPLIWGDLLENAFAEDSKVRYIRNTLLLDLLAMCTPIYRKDSFRDMYHLVQISVLEVP